MLTRVLNPDARAANWRSRRHLRQDMMNRMTRAYARSPFAVSTALSVLAAIAVLHSCIYDWEAAGGGPTTQPTTSSSTNSTSSGGNGAAAGAGGGATGGAGNAGATTTGGGPPGCSTDSFVCGAEGLCCKQGWEFCETFSSSDSADCLDCSGCPADPQSLCSYVLGNLVDDADCPGATCDAGTPDTANEGAIWVHCP